MKSQHKNYRSPDNKDNDYSNLTVDLCKSMYKANQTPRNIFLHIRMVNAVAKFLAQKLVDAKVSIDFDLVDKASLLHDVDKIIEIKNGKPRHPDSANEKLSSMGYPRLGHAIKNHEFEAVKTIDGENNLKNYEDILVFYADKRTKHDHIVSIDERIDDLKVRYSKIATIDFEDYRKPILEVEQKIFKNLKIKPEDITIDAVKPYLIGDDY